MNKTVIGIVLAVIVIIGAAFLIMRGPGPTDTALNPDGTQNTSGANSSGNNNTPEGQGRIIFSVTDAAANMSAISEVNLRINKVEVHTEGGAWSTVSTTPRAYNLLDLNAKNESRLLADANLKNGNYDSLRLNIESVTVKTKTGATKVAKLPTSVLAIGTKIVVTRAQTASAEVDFIASDSLHTTTVGDYIFAPVVKLNSLSDAKITVDAGGVVRIDGGHKEMITNVGMDIDGSVRAGFMIDKDAKLNLDMSGQIKIDTTP